LRLSFRSARSLSKPNIEAAADTELGDRQKTQEDVFTQRDRIFPAAARRAT
jgi:hypothetical protein